MDNRRLFLAAALSMALVIAWSFLFPPQPMDQQGAPRPEAGAESPAPAPPATPSPAPVPDAPGSPSGTQAQAPIQAKAAPPISAQREQTVVIRVEGIRAVFTNRGAQLLSMEVLGADGKEMVDLVRRRRQGPYPYGLTTASRQPHPLDQALFAASPSPDGRSVTFRYRGPEGEAEKTFGFDENRLLDVRVRVAGPPGWGLVVGPGIRNLKAEELNSQFVKPGVVFKKDEVSILAPQSTDEARSVPGEGLRWIGIEDTYFLAAMIPQSGLDRAVVEPFLIEGAGAKEGVRFIPLPPEDQMSKQQEDLPRDLRVILKAAGDTLALRSYWGSKEYEKLAALPYGLEETVQLGYFSFLVRPLLAGLHWIYEHIVPNYGWAIVVMTVLIRILLLPLTHTSMKSMKKMQELNPKMQAIRAKYATKLRDKQNKPNVEMQRKMNEEMMGLYKEHGVNPAGGCLPILLQMPILFAFYNLLSTAVELRGAPWLLWIRDLSAADPYYVLPLVMGATQFLQVKLSPQTGDPMQRRMFMIMPLAFTFLFLGFPSGLVLYWLTNNILTIVQQGVYNRLQTRSA